MGWRSAIISQPARLSVRHRQLLIEQDAGASATLPLEDLSVIVLDTPQTLITGALLAELAACGALLLTCDDTHHPNGMLLPYLPHSRSLQVMRDIAPDYLQGFMSYIDTLIWLEHADPTKPAAGRSSAGEREGKTRVVKRASTKR